MRWREEGRDSLNWPEMRGEDVGPPMAQPMMDEEPMEEEAPEVMEEKPAMASRMADARMAAKAAKCIRIARAMFPDAPKGVIKHQAADLLELSDGALLSTMRRQRVYEKMKEDEVNASTDVEAKEMAPEKMKAQEEDEEVLSKKKVELEGAEEAPEVPEEAPAEEAPAEVQAAEEKECCGEEPVASEDEAEEEEKEESESTDDEEEGKGTEASVLDDILAGAEGEGSDDIELEASAMETEEVPAEEGSLLDRLFEDLQAGVSDITAKARSKAQDSPVPPRKGVQSIRQVVASKKGSANEASTLQGLWKGAPDVSGVFSQ